jgi:hypothetical protein
MENEKIVRLQVLIDTVQGLLPLSKLGFVQSSKFVSAFNPGVAISSGNVFYPAVIYNSEFCRIMFLMDRDRHDEQMQVYYGRLHAPDQEKIVIWNNIECHCWHNFRLALRFLDGDSPNDVVGAPFYYCRGLKDFLESSPAGRLSEVEWIARLHATAWEYFGHNLFQLFDVCHPELWTKYKKFVKDYYDLIGRNPIYQLPLDQIC